jgi:hypothetical protein
MASLKNCFEFLLNYPVKETPYPKGYPDDLRFDHYPGKDFVVGVCDENIELLMQGLMTQKNPQARELIKDYIELYKQIRLRRQKQLGKV